MNQSIEEVIQHLDIKKLEAIMDTLDHGEACTNKSCVSCQLRTKFKGSNFESWDTPNARIQLMIDGIKPSVFFIAGFLAALIYREMLDLEELVKEEKGG